MMLRFQLHKCVVIAAALLSFIYADVTVSVATSGRKATLENNTPSLWKAGGVRFRNQGFNWVRTDDGYANALVSNTPVGSTNEVEIIIASYAAGQEVKVLPSKTKYFTHPWVSNPVGTDLDPNYEPEVLLRTGAAGKIEDPIDPDPITIDDLDSLINTPDFYSESYRYSYTDSLGVNGGKYSGGFLDTWYNNFEDKAETQIHFPIPADTFTLNNFDINLDTSATKGPMYWISLAMAQEYFRVDYQWMMAMGIKEGNAGVKKQHFPNDVHYDGTLNHTAGLGAWHTEIFTGIDRALTYSNYYPKYESVLSSSQDLASSGLSANYDFVDYFCGAETPIESAKIINTMVFSVITQYANYDVFAYSTDICWKEALASAVDPYMGLGAMIKVYNEGNSHVKSIAGDLNADAYEATCQNPNAHLLWGTGQNNYIPSMLVGIQNFVDASKESQTNSGIEIIDYQIKKSELLDAFFGDGGTVDVQGDGGLLLHFYDMNAYDCKFERQGIWDDLNEAFDLVAGKAPSTNGTNTISFRYDLASIFRIVKDRINFKRRAPSGGDAVNIIIPANSGNYKACDPLIDGDEKYPYAAFSTAYDVSTEDFVVIDTVTDNRSVKEAVWSLDYNWNVWFDSEVVDTSKEDKKIFKITIPKKLVEEYRKKDQFSGRYVWIFSTDGAGNTVVSKLPVPYKNPTLLDSAAAFDLDGDGITDQVKAYVHPGDLADLTDFKQIKYAWPSTTPEIIANKGDTKVTASSDTIIVTDPSLSGGAGLGSFSYAIDTMYTIYDPAKQVSDTGVLGPVDIDDKVGPAISAATILMEDSRLFDTLTITVSEKLTKYDKTNFLYCQFKKGSDIHDINADKIEKVSDFEYRVYFAKSTLENEDSVRFAYETDPLEDEVGNKPASYNQWVKINFKGGKEPEFKSAAMFDTDGDGDGDSLKFEITLGGAVDKYTVSDITGGSYSWPGTSLNETFNIGSFVDATDDAFSYEYDVLEGAGTGRFEIDFPGGFKIDKGIADKVGPAIVTAVLSIHDENREKDTLWLTVTEELNNIGQTSHEYCYLKVGNTEAKEVSSLVEVVSPKVYKFIFDKGVVVDKDSVKFVYDNNPVEDVVGNIPMSINQRIPIVVVGGKEPKLTSANMYDIDGDGRGDSVRVILKLGSSKDKYTTSDIADGAYSWPGTSLGETLEQSDMLSKNESEFSFLYDTDGTNGIGQIVMNFPESFPLNGDINDKVGPSIDSAVCLQQDVNRNKDTLLLEVSETLADNFNDNTKYIILFEDSSDTKGDTVKVEKTALSNSWYQMIIPKNAVVYGDWVQFVYDSGIEDAAGNRPLDINKKVKINVKGDVAPNISKAEIYDVKGSDDLLDGDGDSIFIDLELSDDPKALTVDSLKEVEYTWSGTTKTKSRGDLVRISASKFAIVDESLSGGSGTGTIKLIFENDNYRVEDEIRDKVAPVIKSAKYYNWMSEKDTLIVTFSEELNEDGSDFPFTLKSGTSLKVRPQDVSGAVVTYSIEGDDDVAFGDSIWIKSNEDIVDKADNEQKSDDNRHVLINYKRVTAVVEAQYFDTDSRSDGYIDEIVLVFDADLNENDVKVLKDKITLPSERFLTINDMDVDGQELTLLVSQNTSEAELNTAREEYDQLSVSYVEGVDTLCFASDGKIDIEDRLAPVIASARFLPVNDKKDGKLIDTLFVTYSEEVQKTDRKEPFMFSDGSNGDTEYTFEIDGDVDGKVSVPYAAEYRASNTLPGAGDSIWIDESGEIEDVHGNRQERNSVPVELTVGKYPRDYDVWITPTPYDMKNYKEDSLVSIRILPKTRKLPDNISAQAVIYDKVGNVIKKITDSDFGDVEDEMLTYSFLPNNKNNRRLGEGSYAVKVIVKTDGGDPLPYDVILYIKGVVPGQKEKEEFDKEDE